MVHFASATAISHKCMHKIVYLYQLIADHQQRSQLQLTFNYQKLLWHFITSGLWIGQNGFAYLSFSVCFFAHSFSVSISFALVVPFIFGKYKRDKQTNCTTLAWSAAFNSAAHLAIELLLMLLLLLNAMCVAKSPQSTENCCFALWKWRHSVHKFINAL